MKITYLRIGNCVAVNSGFYKVASIAEKNVTLKDSDGKILFTSIEHIKGIDLRAEGIVDACETSRIIDIIHFKNEALKSFYLKPFFNSKFDSNYYTLKINIGFDIAVLRYVHELQNVIFSLKGIEIKFEI